MHNAKHVATSINLSRSLRFILCISIVFSFESTQHTVPSRTGTYVIGRIYCNWRSFANQSLLSMSYNRNKQGKSGIVDFRQAYIQNLEDTLDLP